jgi:hypothetical protein
VEQDKFAQSYENYVIISDADIQYFVKNNQKSCNIEIYSADAKLLSWFTYPRNVMGNFNGFGPDGRNVEFAENEDSWSLYELNFEDVLNCRGETVQPQLVSERKYGTFMRE